MQLDVVVTHDMVMTCAVHARRLYSVIVT